MKKVTLSIVIFIITLEVLLRVTGRFQTTSEKNTGLYTSPNKLSLTTWFHHWTPYDIIDNTTSEFSYQNQYNDLGHRETASSELINDTSSIKVVCLGDSFTEGDGAPADSTWVKKLDELSNKNIRYYNAGVCGSDVFFNNKMLVYKLGPIKPTVVIECLNTSDLSDVLWMGGNERFQADSTTLGRAGNEWELLYRYSHVVRAIIHTLFKLNDNLIKTDQVVAEEIKSARLIEQQVESTAAYCKQHNIKYYLVIHPCPYEIGVKLSGADLLNKYLGEKPYTINLFPILDSFYQTNNIKQFSHAINGHYNSKGYWIMGEKIYTELAKRDSLFKGN